MIRSDLALRPDEIRRIFNIQWSRRGLLELYILADTIQH